MLFQKSKQSPVGMWFDQQPSTHQEPLLAPSSPARPDLDKLRGKMLTLRKLSIDLKSRIALIGTNKDTNSFRRQNADLSQEVGGLLRVCKNEIMFFQEEEYKRIQAGKGTREAGRKELSEKEIRKVVSKLRLELEEIARSVNKIMDDMTQKNKRHIENVRQTMIGSRKMSKMTGNNHTASQDSSHGYGRADSNRTDQSEGALFHQQEQQQGPQFLEIDIQSQIINNRQQDLDRIQKVMNDVKDIAVSINQEAVSQEEKIDQVAAKTERAKDNISEGNKELDKASVLQKSGTCKLLIIVGAVVLVVVIVIIVLVVLKKI